MAFEVVPDELRTHASHLDGLTDRLNTAVDAAKSVVMDNAAYGLLCAFLPPIVNATTQNDATDALHAAVEGMTTTSDNVRTAAQSYDDTDQANADPFQKQLAADGKDSPASTPRLQGTRIGVTEPRQTSQPVEPLQRQGIGVDTLAQHTAEGRTTVSEPKQTVTPVEPLQRQGIGVDNLATETSQGRDAVATPREQVSE